METKARVSARSFVLGFVSGAVAEGGRARLLAHGTVDSDAVAETLGFPAAGDGPCAWRLVYEGGDTATLTWTATNEKELVAVPGDEEARRRGWRDRLARQALAPRRLEH